MTDLPRIPTSAPLPAGAASQMDAKQRMVVTTAKLLQRQGYHATGLKQIVREADAPRGSIYHHFPGGKDELAEQAITVAAAELTRAIERAAHPADTPGDVLRRLAQALSRWLERSSFQEGCPVSTVTLEVAPLSPALTAACRAAYDEWIGMIAARLRQAGVAADDAEELATTAVATLEGALLLCRARQDVGPLHSSSARVAALLDEAVRTVSR